MTEVASRELRELRELWDLRELWERAMPAIIEALASWQPDRGHGPLPHQLDPAP